jgi:hypothetical protein
MVRVKVAQQVEFMVRGLSRRAEFALCWGGAAFCVLRAVVASRFFAPRFFLPSTVELQPVIT